MRLIVTEKDNSAKKIAQILSGGKAKQGKSYGIPFYEWQDESDHVCVIGLKGHLMNPVFPEGYSEWRKVEPRELIDAPLQKEPIQKSVHKALRKQARDADSVVIATDFDREGELIGLEALEEILDVNSKIAGENGRVTGANIRRARFSALTQGGDRGGLLQPGRPVRAACPRRRGASGHRPDLGCDADAVRVARHRPPGLEFPVRRARAEPDPRDRRRPRARAARPRRQALLGGVRGLRASRRPVHGTSQGGQVLGRGRGQGRARQHQEPGHRAQGRVQAQHSPSAGAVQHDRIYERSLECGCLAGARDADRRRPLHGRIHLLPADRQHRLSGLPSGARAAAVDRTGRRLRRGRADRVEARAHAHPRQEADDRPPADLSHAGARPEGAAGRRPPQDLRARRAALRRDVRRSRGVGVHARRYRGRHRGLLRARQRADRARLPRDLPVRALEGRGDPEGRGGPGASARRGRGLRRGPDIEPVVRRQGNAAAVADRAGHG